MTLTYLVKIDRLNAGDFLDPYSDVSDRVLAEPGVEIEYGRDQARSLAPPMIGACSFTLDNRDALFSPANGASPWYQMLRPNRPVQLAATQGDPVAYRTNLAYRSATPYRGLTWSPLFRGYTSGLRYRPALGERVVEFDAIGVAARLQRATISLPLATNLQTDEALALVLDEVGWPADKRALSVGDTTLREWWVNERRAWDVAVELLASEGAGAALYEDPYGVLHFENRNYRSLASRSTTSQATFYDEALPGELYHTAFAYEPHWEDVYNRAKITTQQRQLQVEQVVWTHGATVTPTAGTPIELRVQTSDPFEDAVTPVLNTDYTVAGGTVSVAITWTDAASTVVTVTNTGGSPVVSDLQLRAKPYTVIGETTIDNPVGLEADADDQTYVVPAWPGLDYHHAGAILASVVTRYFLVRPRIAVTVADADDAHIEALLTLRPSDRITVQNTHLGLAQDLFIERVSYRITAGGRITATFDCEPTVDFPGSAWESAIWDTDVWGL